MSALIRSAIERERRPKIVRTVGSAIRCRVRSTPRGVPVWPFFNENSARNKKPCGNAYVGPDREYRTRSGSDLGSGLCQPSQSRFEHWRPMMYLDLTAVALTALNAHQYPCLFHPSRKSGVARARRLRPSRCCDPFPCYSFLH